MIKEPLAAVYEGKGIIRLREHIPPLQENQDLLITIVPIPIKSQTDETQPSPLEYFRQIVDDLDRYEKKHGMTSEEFYQQFQSGDLQEG